MKQAPFALFFKQGQCCCAGSQFVQEDIYTESVKQSITWARSCGPQVDETQLKKVLGYIKSGKEEGVKLLCDRGVTADLGYFV
ncbi:hypothetical protein GH733_008065 [Mirounga leonina]|nr:hypothetical protein GH733_008065 [Mirounga leonina]